MLTEEQKHDRTELLGIAQEAVEMGAEIDLRYKRGKGFRLHVEAGGATVSFERTDAHEYDGGPWKVRPVKGRVGIGQDLEALAASSTERLWLARWAERALEELRAQDALRAAGTGFQRMAWVHWKEAIERGEVYRTAEGAVVVPLGFGRWVIATPGSGRNTIIPSFDEPVEPVPEVEVPGLLIQCADILPSGVADIPCPPRHREAVLARLPELADLLLIQDQEEVEVGAAVEPDGHPRVLVQWSSAQTRRDTEARRQFGNAMTAQTRHANALVPAHDPDLSDLDGPYPGMPWDGPGIPGLLF